MKKPKIPFLFGKLGVSYTISAVIMTVTAITLTLVASSYAYQILEQQRGATEFDVAMKSILAFDDALENVAWKPQASRSARFTVDYGQLELIPNDALRGMHLIVNVTGYPNASYSLSRDFFTGYIRYGTKTKYANFGEGYQSYFLGNNRTISNGAGSYGRASIEQGSGWVYMTLTYGVRVMKASTINVTDGDYQVRVNYVDIWIIKIDIAKWSTYIGDFDLKAKCLNVTTIPDCGPEGNGYNLDGDKQCNITVQLGEDKSYTPIQLDGDKVVFNFVIATVQVGV
ncbi:hypothetical protein IBX38_07625 [Candidatus Bathyarchaeota archaeon]|nr:hypothetical protein [Candidatus Bathyarchaeota archaeon]